MRVSRRLRELEARAQVARQELYALEAESVRLRDQIRECTDAFAGLIPRMMQARDVQRLAERAIAIAREPAR